MGIQGKSDVESSRCALLSWHHATWSLFLEKGYQRRKNGQIKVWWLMAGKDRRKQERDKHYGGFYPNSKVSVRGQQKDWARDLAMVFKGACS